MTYNLMTSSLPSDIDAEKKGTTRPKLVRFCRRSLRETIFNNKKQLKKAKLILGRTYATKARVDLLEILV